MRERVRADLRAFDPDGAQFVDRLLDAGLDARAEERLAELERTAATAKIELDDARRRLRESGAPEPAELTCAVAEGDLRHARRLAEKALRDHERARSSPASRWARGLAERARTRSLRLAPDLASRVRGLAAVDAPSVDEARALAAELSRALYDESLSGARAAVAIARVRDNLPEGAGPYNPQVIAAEALDRLGALSPDYAAAIIASLDDLAALDALLPPPKTKSRAPARRKR